MSVGEAVGARTTPHDQLPRVRTASLKVVIADADEDSAQQLALALHKHNIQVTVCPDGAETLLQIGLVQPDVLLVSASLPVLDGATVVAVLRRRRTTPVIVGVAGSDAAEAVRALTAGATACVRKPYQLPEILPLLQATRPDLPVSAPTVIRCGALELDDTAHEVRFGCTPLALPLREFELLRYFMRHRRRVLGQRELLDQIWGPGHTGDPSTLAVHVNRLRNRLGDAGAPADLIQTLRGVGYRLSCND
jgi:DNA-binding response OmpR family regulator